MRTNTVIGFISFFCLIDVCDAKCEYGATITAKIEIEKCQGVRFDASPSKYNWFPGDAVNIHQQGETIVGTLLVGKVKSTTFSEKKSGSKIPDSWKAGSTKTLFFDRESKEACPKILPSTYQVQPSGRCCDVLPFRGECLVPNTIGVIKSMEPEP